MALVVAIGAAPFYYRKIFFRVEEEIRARVETQLAAQLPHLDIRVRAAHLSGDGIEIRGLTIAERGAVGPQPKLAYLDEIFLTCQTSVHELLSASPRVTGVTIRRPVLWATRRPDNSFSLGKLFPLPKPQRTTPPIQIEDGTIEVFDPLKNPSSTFTLRDINFSIKPVDSETSESRVLELNGYLLADQIQRIELVGRIDPAGEQWSLEGTVDGLELSPALRSSLPEKIAEPLDALGEFSARANFRFQLQGQDHRSMPRFEVSGNLVNGRLVDPLLPQPLLDLQARFQCDNQQLLVTELTARQGQTAWRVDYFKRQGYGADSPLVIRGGAKQLHLNRQWAETLKEPWKTHYLNYSPDGDIDLEATLAFDGRQWQPTLHATCLGNVSFSCHKFPYRLEGGRGTLALKDDVLKIDLTAYSGPPPEWEATAAQAQRETGPIPRRVTLQGEFLNPGPRFTGQIEIRAQQIPFDENLFKALKPRAQQTVRALNPNGLFDVYARFWRDDPSRREMHEHVELDVHARSISYNKFAYPLYNVHGQLTMDDGQWQFRDLVGTNDTGVVACTGSLQTTPTDDHLHLRLDARNVPLGVELRTALDPAQQQLWDALQPRGTLNFVADVDYDSRNKHMDLELHTTLPGDHAGALETSIQPLALPIRMERLGGKVHYHNGHAELQGITAIHRNVTLRTDGDCDLARDGTWQLRLKNLIVDRLRLLGENHDVLTALPEALKRAVDELRPTGPINLRGALTFDKRRLDLPVQTAWDVELIFNRGSLQVGPKLENIFGSVRVAGTAAGKQYHGYGELKLDSVNYKNFQFTEVAGPFLFDNQHVVLGYWAPQNQSQGRPVRHVTARLLGGAVRADCKVDFGTLPQFHLIGTASAVDMAAFARENLSNHQDLKGRVLANFDIHGNGTHNLTGLGNVHLTDTDVYQLPVMVALLKVIYAKPPDTTAFTQCDMKFQIRDKHIYLNPIELHGDVVNLSGGGELTFDGLANPINLELHTMVDRGNLPLVSSVLRAASRQIMTFHVAGPLDNPEVTTDVLPGAKGALQTLTGDPQRSTLFPRINPFMRTLGTQP